MWRRPSVPRLTRGCILLVTVFLPANFHDLAASESKGPEVLIIAGPCKHPPGTHEAAAGARLLEHLVKSAKGPSPVRAEMFEAWPKDASLLNNAKSIVFIGDIFPPQRMENPAEVLAELGALMDRGCGIVCIHYATGLRAQDVAEDGSHPLLKWLGGYFATGCPHHRSVARICTSTVVPVEGKHPVLNGWSEFTFDDEPYWNNYFGKDGLADNVTALATSMLPPTEPKKEIVAWAVQRPDGGRGVGVVLPHYFRNWKVDDLRMLILNSIFWTAKSEIPAGGVQTVLPDLAKFQPASVTPKPRKKK